jgi:predicted nucleotide-binding protein
MMLNSKELTQLASQLKVYDDFQLRELDALEYAANAVAKSWSGSWLGYHSKIYYAGFQSPSSHAVFSREWGIPPKGPDDFLGLGSLGDWIEYDFDDVVAEINKRAGNQRPDWCRAEGKKAQETFEEAQQSVLSLIHASSNLLHDRFIKDLMTKIESIEILTERYFIERQRPSGRLISRDTIAINEGSVTPPHIVVLSQVHAARAPFHACTNLRKLILSLAKHVQNLDLIPIQENRIGNKIFIGHGHSPLWREFKDFLSEKLNLAWDEFNRVPVAGVPNTIRLAQMLNQACMAFLIMTAEDEDVNGNLRARMNVVHEAGLFQGRLGFERAIILLEDGCEGFSNIEGLGQIRFPKGNIAAIFEEVRQVLQREGLIK